MIKIIVTNNEEFNSDITSECTIDSEATTSDCFEAFARLLLLCGYGEESIRAAAEDLEYTYYESIDASHIIMLERRDIGN